MFVRNAESNFRKAEIKKIAEKRRQRLDKEHGIDREEQMRHFEELDKIYRISEKEEIKKYLEIGKTPKQYYEEQAARGFPKDDATTKASADGSEAKQTSTQVLKETLMQKSEEGVEVSHIAGRDFEQIKVSAGAGSVPDPRVAGPSIFFDSRLDAANERNKKGDPLLMAMGERQKRAGSISPEETPAFLKPKQTDAPSLRSGFKNDSEALYVPQRSTYEDPAEAELHRTVERYNTVNAFLNKIDGSEQREFAHYLLLKLLPTIDTTNLVELDSLLEYVSKASSTSLDNEFN